jgi:2-oxoglutarate dehydrogenase E2 component (dihydrolipoamide succinyltransferase)
MRRAIAAHMVRSRATSPHALTAMEVDMGQVAAARARAGDDFARRGIDLTYTACIALVAVEALLRHPLLNSFWSDAGIVLRRRVHLGIAVALPDGLITPVIREAQDLNLRGMARAVADAARRARASALRPGEASGGTFTVTNPGAGSLWFGTPIIAQPQSAILGVGAVRKRPLVVDEGGVDGIAVRPTALLTLAYDARILDQCRADAFLRDVKRKLEHFDSSDISLRYL